MTGSDLLDWINEYFEDLTNWQDANVVWLIVRTMIILFVLIWTWRIIKSIFKRTIFPTISRLKYFWFRISPFRKIDLWNTRREQAKNRKRAEEQRRQNELENEHQQSVKRREQQDAVSSIRQLFKIEDD